MKKYFEDKIKGTEVTLEELEGELESEFDPEARQGLSGEICYREGYLTAYKEMYKEYYE